MGRGDADSTALAKRTRFARVLRLDEVPLVRIAVAEVESDLDVRAARGPPARPRAR